jgi:cell division septum initiation protein DivIVA
MVFSNGKFLAMAAGVAALFGFQQYGMMTGRHAVEDRIGALETQLQSVRDADSASVTRVSSDLGVVSEKLGITEKDLEKARKQAEMLRQEHVRTTKGLREDIASNSQAVTNLREETTTNVTKLAEGQNDATQKIGVVTGDVQNVKVDLDST